MLPEPADCALIDFESIQELEGPLVDVRTPEAFAECRIPGAVNHCVYEVAFMEEFPKAYPDRNTAITVYGDGDPYKADLAAVGRLRSLDYRNVSVLEGGLQRWRAKGRAIEGEGPSDHQPFSGILKLDTDRSKIRWVGRNLSNQHDGEVTATEGFLKLEKGVPVEGKVVVDLRKLTCRDISDTKMASMLIGHLQNADFFLVEKHPLASFQLNTASPINGSSYGQPNYRISGILSARGKQITTEIEAQIEPTADGYVFQSNFNFNRVALGAAYGSGNLFERLGMHLVNDLVSIDVTTFFIR